MNTEILIPLLVIVVFVIFRYLVLKKLDSKRNKKVFYAENKMDKYFPNFYRGVICVLGCVLLVRITDNEYIAALLSILWLFSFALFDFYFFTSKMLIIEDDKIRCPLRWKFRIEDLKEWHLDKEKRAISFTDKHNKEYHFSAIKDYDMEMLQGMLNRRK